MLHKFHIRSFVTCC